MYYNPYSPYMMNNQVPIQQQQPVQQQQAVIRVHGEEGAKAYSLPPNSSILLLDETKNVVWLKMTDGAGYPTTTGYEIKPIENKVNNEYESLEERIKRIEDDIYGKQSNTASTKQSTK